MLKVASIFVILFAFIFAFVPVRYESKMDNVTVCQVVSKDWQATGAKMMSCIDTATSGGSYTFVRTAPVPSRKMSCRQRQWTIESLSGFVTFPGEVFDCSKPVSI